MPHLAKITDQPIDVLAVADLVALPSVGATCVFVGRVRDHDPLASQKVAAIEYTTHPDAEVKLLEAVARVAQGAEAAAVHRIGTLTVGEVAMVVAVGTPHRQSAFDLCPALVDEIKATVPIWKRQIEVDGSCVWAGLPQ